MGQWTITRLDGTLLLQSLDRGVLSIIADLHSHDLLILRVRIFDRLVEQV